MAMDLREPWWFDPSRQLAFRDHISHARDTTNGWPHTEAVRSDSTDWAGGWSGACERLHRIVLGYVGPTATASTPSQNGPQVTS